MAARDIAALLIFLAPLAYSPGPGNAFFAVNGARHGLAGVTAALAGYHAATFVVTLAIGLGLSVTVLRNASLTWTLTLLSALYMFRLAWRSIRDAAAPVAALTSKTAGPGFGAGALLLVCNPKAYVIIVMMFAAFLNAGSPAAGVALIAGIFTLNNLVAFIVWAMAGRLVLAPLSGRAASATYALSFTLVGLWLIIDHP
jgi:threonine/homoserine/homoserine lactone efflux protein